METRERERQRERERESTLVERNERGAREKLVRGRTITSKDH